MLASHTDSAGMSITDLSKECDLALSTLHRILKALIKQGLIEQDAQTKLYRLGVTWLEYGLQVYDTVDYVTKIRPELERLSREVDESVYLSRLAGNEALIIERIDSENNQIRIHDQLGLRIPMTIGAANKTMLATLPSKEARAILKQLLPEEQVEEQIQLLKQVKKNGYAISHGERTEGTSSFAVAVVDGFGELVGSISIGCVSFNLTDERTAFLIEKVVETRERVSAKLGYREKESSL
jgi:DNA-binding IclR family transcriptional regulator